MAAVRRNGLLGGVGHRPTRARRLDPDSLRPQRSERTVNDLGKNLAPGHEKPVRVLECRCERLVEHLYFRDPAAAEHVVYLEELVPVVDGMLHRVP